MALFSIAIAFAVLPVAWLLGDDAADGVQSVSGLLPAGAEVCASAGATTDKAASNAAMRPVFILDSRA